MTTNKIPPYILCIPRVINTITIDKIHNIFDKLELGEIDKIDLTTKIDIKGDKYKRVYIHYKKWWENPNSINVQTRLSEGKEIKIIYDDPWFWKVSEYRPPTTK
jgi:hypothetical protein